MELQLTGRRALVTGSSSGIGTGIARLVAAEGVAVVVPGRNAERTEAVRAELAASGTTVAAALGDLSTDEGADAVAEAAAAAVGDIAVLVNDAGGAAGVLNPSWFTTDLPAWIDTYQKNVMAAAGLINHVTPATIGRA